MPPAEQKVELTALGSIQSQHETFAGKLSVVAGPLLSHKTNLFQYAKADVFA
jgi:hypothetical protein